MPMITGTDVIGTSALEVQIKYGSIQLGEPTGKWVRRGELWYQVYSDTIWRDQNGRETRREPCEAIVGVSFPFDAMGRPIDIPTARRGWFWRLLGMERELPTEAS